MSLFKKLNGVIDSLFQVGGPTGNGIKAETYGLSIRDSLGTTLKRLGIGRASASTDAATYLDVKEKGILIQFSFTGASAPSPGSNTGNYGMCHTSGGLFTAGAIYLDSGSSLDLVTGYKGQLILTTSAFTGSVSLSANGLYIAQSNSAPFTWTLKGDGAPAATGLTKSIKLTTGLASPVNSSTSIPASAEITEVVLDIGTGYSAGTNIQVVINGSSPLEVMATTENDPTQVATYSRDQRTVVGASNAGAVQAIISGGPAAGAGVVVVKYIEAYFA